MYQTEIFRPFCATMVLTLAVWVYMYGRRLSFIFSGSLDPKQMTPPELARLSVTLGLVVAIGQSCVTVADLRAYLLRVGSLPAPSCTPQRYRRRLISGKTSSIKLSSAITLPRAAVTHASKTDNPVARPIRCIHKTPPRASSRGTRTFDSALTDRQSSLLFWVSAAWIRQEISNSRQRRDE